jgi:hypothetical protein
MYKLLKCDDDSEEENKEDEKKPIANNTIEKNIVFTNKIVIDYENNCLNPDDYSKEEKTELFKLAVEEEKKGNIEISIKYYEILCGYSHRVSFHNLAHIYWDKNNLNMAFKLFRCAIELKYLNSMYDCALLISENLDKFSEKRSDGLNMLKTYIMLKNATPDEKEIWFNLQ